MAIGLPHEIAHGSLRLTIDRENTEEQVDFILEKLPGLVQRLRDMSPVYPGKRLDRRKTDVYFRHSYKLEHQGGTLKWNIAKR